MHRFASELAAALRAHPEHFVLSGAPSRSYLDNVDAWYEQREASQAAAKADGGGGDAKVSADIAHVLGQLDALQRRVNSPTKL